MPKQTFEKNNSLTDSLEDKAVHTFPKSISI